MMGVLKEMNQDSELLEIVIDDFTFQPKDVPLNVRITMEPFIPITFISHNYESVLKRNTRHRKWAKRRLIRRKNDLSKT